MTETAPAPVKLGMADIAVALRHGFGMLRAMPRSSIAYAVVPSALGLGLILAIITLGFSPLVLPFAGGFMLLGPILLSGYFELALRHEQGMQPTPGDAFHAFAKAPPALWMLALICVFLFLIWITDAAVLYSFTIGGVHLGYDFAWVAEFGHRVLHFELWGSLMGMVLAYMIFTVSAFSVPLVYERRAGLVEGINASTRCVLGNFPVSLAWGLLLGAIVIPSVLLLPVLLVTLPLMSYASFSLYRRAFPAGEQPGAEPQMN